MSPSVCLSKRKPRKEPGAVNSLGVNTRTCMKKAITITLRNKAAQRSSTGCGFHFSALFVFISAVYSHPAPHSGISGRFGSGASTERLVALVKYPGLKRAWPQLELIRPFPSNTLCSDFCRHPLSVALLCDANVAVSPCHFVARHGESAEGCNWPQSDSFAGWPNSEGCVACSARKPSAAPTVKATAASRAKRSLIRIRREACRRGRPARAGRPHQMPHRLVGISDQTACGSLSLGEQTTAGNDVARTGPRGNSFAYSFRFAGPLGGIVSE